MFLTHAPDASNRIFVVEVDGTIAVFPNDQKVSSKGLFLDIRSKVWRGNMEMGLLGMAFDPKYTQNGYFYVHYSAKGSVHKSRISRFQVSNLDPNKADPKSEFVLLEVTQPYRNHNGGMLAFGPDGYLYIGLGDGGSGGDPQQHGQNRKTLLGTLLRIDPHGKTGKLPYGIPKNNPFVGAGAGIREEIWAYGLRNPWRFSFDRLSGQLWLADVGQSKREEVDIIERGGNYGWRIREGDVDYKNPLNLPPSMFKEPLISVKRNDARSIIGGYVYRGSRLPELKGAYLYGDWVTGKVWAAVEKKGKLLSNTLVNSKAKQLASFGVDQKQELYLVSHNGPIYTLDRDLSSPPKFPLKLSDTKLFSDLKNMSPAKGVYPYEVRHPFWADHAEKTRFFAYPGKPIGFTPKSAWSFAKGTVLVKHFDMEMRIGDPSSKRRLETRVMVHEADAWAGYTYRWNSAQTDALLVPFDGATEKLSIRDRSGTKIVRVQDWRYPSRNECMQCHTAAAGYALSTQTRQLNKLVTHNNKSIEQLEHWDAMGMFHKKIGAAKQYERFAARGDQSVKIETQARTWLDVNCAMCHQPGGGTPSNIDLRLDSALTQTKIWDILPSHGSLGLRKSRIVKPYEHENSVLWERVRRLGSGRMPQIGSNQVDQYAVQLLRDWIGSPVTSFGSSCGTSTPAPALQMLKGGEARIGSTLRMELVSLPTNEGAILLLGSSRTNWGAAKLPVKLDPLGMTGCELLVPNEVPFPAKVSGGRASWNLAIPNDSKLLSAEFFLQGFALAKGSNPFGAITSNGAAVKVLRP